MKKKNIFIIAVIVALAAIPALAQKSNVGNPIKVKELTLKRDSLKKQIAVEDTKREKTISGVSPETQEALNEKQDSVCLALRSQLVSVELELKELVPNKTTATLVNQLNNLKPNQQQGQSTTNSSSTVTGTKNSK